MFLAALQDITFSVVVHIPHFCKYVCLNLSTLRVLNQLASQPPKWYEHTSNKAGKTRCRCYDCCIWYTRVNCNAGVSYWQCLYWLAAMIGDIVLVWYYGSNWDSLYSSQIGVPQQGAIWKRCTVTCKETCWSGELWWLTGRNQLNLSHWHDIERWAGETELLLGAWKTSVYERRSESWWRNKRWREYYVPKKRQWGAKKETLEGPNGEEDEATNSGESRGVASYRYECFQYIEK